MNWHDPYKGLWKSAITAWGALLIDLIILVGLIYIKGKDDPSLLVITFFSMVSIFGLEKLFLRKKVSNS